jgi:adenylylsulfate kinase
LAFDRNHPKKDTANLIWHEQTVTREQREKANGHRAALVWLTGLPGSGKSTIAHGVEANLHRLGFNTVALDGDNIRHGLCADLGFSVADRNENIRHTGEVAKLLLELGVVVFVALISPLRARKSGSRSPRAISSRSTAAARSQFAGNGIRKACTLAPNSPASPRPTKRRPIPI